jgi:hypothetical protein
MSVQQREGLEALLVFTVAILALVILSAVVGTAF